MDHTRALPDDALADILGRLPPRDLAASRCVRKAWRAVADARGLLRPHVLPHALRGLFLSRRGHAHPISFFACPKAQPPTIDGGLGFLPCNNGGIRQILDHCNGLLLYRDLTTLRVVNPATRSWDHLPWKEVDGSPCLAFDPASSLRYEVFSIPRDAEKVLVNPPSSWTLSVFSSSTQQWHKRWFARQGGARLDPVYPGSMWCQWGRTRCSGTVYWQGSLYVNLHGLSLVRLSSSDGKYQVIKMPIDVEGRNHICRPYVGKSENGVYFAKLDDTTYQLRIWILVQSSEQVDWVIKHRIDLRPCGTVGFSRLHNSAGIGKTWIVDGDDDNLYGSNDMLMAENLDWDSDDDNVANIQDSYGGVRYYYNDIRSLGFHPYKEVVFLGLGSLGRVAVAHHLNSSKVQYLGELHPKDCSLGIYESFPYTPCMIGHLLKHGSEISTSLASCK